MRIYNEIVLQWDDKTQQFNTIHEDSYEYNGSVMLAQGGLPVGATAISANDTITDTIKNTAGYFTGGDATLEGTQIFTGSLSNSNQKYYFNVEQSSDSSIAKVQFSVTFGHIAGSGSNQYGDSLTNNKTLFGQTQAIYKQLTQRLMLSKNEATGGFTISQQGSAGALSSGVRDDYVYALTCRRDNFKDRVNKKSWTLVLSGSDNTGDGKQISLTDDSAVTPAISTPAGPRHNIVSGALGVVSGSGYTYKSYGWFYPDRGMFVFSGAELSASIGGSDTYRENTITGWNGQITASAGTPYISGSVDAVSFTTDFSVGDTVQLKSGSGKIQTFRVNGISTDSTPNPDVQVITMSGNYEGASTAKTIHYVSGSIGISTSDITASFSHNTAAIRHSSSGFLPNLYAGASSDPKNAIRLINCMKNVNGTTFRLRSEEDQSQENFFCRISANQYNFSMNPTFVSGSYNKILSSDMHGNPTTFITGVGLYNSAGQLLAVSELSKPLKKNFTSEATIKVKLTY